MQTDGKEIRLKATAGTDIFYKRLFHKDILKQLGGLLALSAEDQQESEEQKKARILEQSSRLEVFQELAFIMAKQGEGTSLDQMLNLTERDYIGWLDELPVDAFHDKDFLQEIVQTYRNNQRTYSQPKN